MIFVVILILLTLTALGGSWYAYRRAFYSPKKGRGEVKPIKGGSYDPYRPEMRRIYQQLKAGKPVLFGGKNSYGGQHWVVITGFTGGSLTASNFTIQDPGSNSRVTLQHFLNVYPMFYKYFYY